MTFEGSRKTFDPEGFDVVCDTLGRVRRLDQLIAQGRCANGAPKWGIVWRTIYDARDGKPPSVHALRVAAQLNKELEPPHG